MGFLGDEESLRHVDRTMDRQRNPPRGLTVQRGREDDFVCERYLRFADEVSISIDASSYEDDAEGDWCPVVDATLDIRGATLELDSTDETIAGYPTVVTSRSDERYASCSVETYTIDSTELGTKEAIIIQVLLSGKGKDACAPTRELATAVWPKLPK